MQTRYFKIKPNIFWDMTSKVTNNMCRRLSQVSIFTARKAPMSSRLTFLAAYKSHRKQVEIVESVPISDFKGFVSPLLNDMTGHTNYRYYKFILDQFDRPVVLYVSKNVPQKLLLACFCFCLVPFHFPFLSYT